MKGQLDTLKDENRALEEKLAAASRGEQDLGVRRAWGERWGEEDMGKRWGEEEGYGGEEGMGGGREEDME